MNPEAERAPTLSWQAQLYKNSIREAREVLAGVFPITNDDVLDIARRLYDDKLRPSCG